MGNEETNRTLTELMAKSKTVLASRRLPTGDLGLEPLEIWRFFVAIDQKPSGIYPSSAEGVRQLTLHWWRLGRELGVLDEEHAVYLSVGGLTRPPWCHTRLRPDGRVVAELAVVDNEPELLATNEEQDVAICVTTEESGVWVLAARRVAGTWIEIREIPVAP